MAISFLDRTNKCFCKNANVLTIAILIFPCGLGDGRSSYTYGIGVALNESFSFKFLVLSKTLDMVQYIMMLDIWQTLWTSIVGVTWVASQSGGVAAIQNNRDILCPFCGSFDPADISPLARSLLYSPVGKFRSNSPVI
jgi:hypothetical protein